VRDNVALIKHALCPGLRNTQRSGITTVALDARRALRAERARRAFFSGRPWIAALPRRTLSARAPISAGFSALPLESSLALNSRPTRFACVPFYAALAGNSGSAGRTCFADLAGEAWGSVQSGEPLRTDRSDRSDLARDTSNTWGSVQSSRPSGADWPWNASRAINTREALIAARPWGALQTSLADRSRRTDNRLARGARYSSSPSFTSLADRSRRTDNRLARGARYSSSPSFTSLAGRSRRTDNRLARGARYSSSPSFTSFPALASQTWRTVQSRQPALSRGSSRTDRPNRPGRSVNAAAQRRHMRTHFLSQARDLGAQIGNHCAGIGKDRVSLRFHQRACAIPLMLLIGEDVAKRLMPSIKN
jgi:hypothetical protein